MTSGRERPKQEVRREVRRKVLVRCFALLLCASAVNGALAQASSSKSDVRRVYIVVLKDESPAPADPAARARTLADTLVRQYGGSVERVYGSALFGFAARLTPAQAQAIAKDARVRYVEEDAPVRTQPAK